MLSSSNGVIDHRPQTRSLLIADSSSSNPHSLRLLVLGYDVIYHVIRNTRFIRHVLCKMLNNEDSHKICILFM